MTAIVDMNIVSRGDYDMNERLCAKAIGSGIEEPRKLNI